MTSRPTPRAGGVPGRRVSSAMSCVGICVDGNSERAPDRGPLRAFAYPRSRMTHGMTVKPLITSSDPRDTGTAGSFRLWLRPRAIVEDLRTCYLRNGADRSMLTKRHAISHHARPHDSGSA